MQTSVYATPDPSLAIQPRMFLLIRSIAFSGFLLVHILRTGLYNMIIRPHHVFMLPVDYIIIYRAVCTMGRDESYGTSVFHWFVLWKVSNFDLSHFRLLNVYYPGGG